jgi:hypothetical protein
VESREYIIIERLVREFVFLPLFSARPAGRAVETSVLESVERERQLIIYIHEHGKKVAGERYILKR